MRAITYSEARENLKSVIDQVISDSTPTMIVRRKGQGSAVLISQSDWESMQETMYLLSSPRNAKDLLDSIAELDAGKGIERALIEP